ncbi:hypothetical protein OCL06_00900 [Alteromonas sp. ASW11-19]|uniref:STAS domain-containing protein n=1 Tax=Alteromonas salexigens TaxID=2982530 RepID=A0ABT2VIZ0_9ALTE|nr:hypothetical protein [Alteromonas salexigens]MCU7553150.1 hypothetical protein [Alteromonas salexigens]
MSDDNAVTTLGSANHKHGSFTLCAFPGAVMVFPRGSWSMPCTEDYLEKIVAVRQSAATDRFVCIVDTSAWELATPDVLDILAKFNMHAVEQGMLGQWLLDETGSVAVTRILASALRRFTNNVHVDSKFDRCAQAVSEILPELDCELLRQVYLQHHTPSRAAVVSNT